LDLFDKCTQFDLALQSARARNRFFYSRAISPAASPLTTREGRELINLGSNNYLGLTDHPKVKAAAVAAIAEYGTGCAGSRLLTGPAKPRGDRNRKAYSPIRSCSRPYRPAGRLSASV